MEEFGSSTESWVDTLHGPQSRFLSFIIVNLEGHAKWLCIANKPSTCCHMFTILPHAKFVEVVTCQICRLVVLAISSLLAHNYGHFLYITLAYLFALEIH